MNIDKRTTNKWINRFIDDPSLSDERRTGAPPLLNDDKKKAIVDRADNDPFVVPKMIKNEQHLHCNERTIDRALINAGLYGRIAEEEPNYSANHFTKRIVFGHAFEHWTKEQWERVIFLDGTTFNLGMNRNRVYVRRPKGEAFNPKYIWKDEGKATPGAGGVTIKVWTGFAANGRLTLGFYDKKLDGKGYIKLINEHLLPSARRLFPSGQWYVLHDNDPPWKGDDVITHLHNKGITSLPYPWPPYSPDLNPAENLWADWKERVYDRNPNGCEELLQFIQEEWGRTDPQLLIKLAHSMIDRCLAVIASNGHKVKY